MKCMCDEQRKKKTIDVNYDLFFSVGFNTIFDRVSRVMTGRRWLKHLNREKKTKIIMTHSPLNIIRN